MKDAGAASVREEVGWTGMKERVGGVPGGKACREAAAPTCNGCRKLRVIELELGEREHFKCGSEDDCLGYEAGERES